MKIGFFGASLLSAFQNPHATYYRGILRALSARGHQIVFYEPEFPGLIDHYDLEPPRWCRVVSYAPTPEGALEAVESAAGSDLIIKAADVGANDDLLESALIAARTPRNMIAYWDLSAPATLARLNADPDDSLAALIPRFDVIFTGGGGGRVVRGYSEHGAQVCVPVYGAADPEQHFPVSADARFRAKVAFLGNRWPDREARAEEFFFQVASWLPAHRFLLGGSGWGGREMRANVETLGHVYPCDHNAFNSTANLILSVSRPSCFACGFYPSTRLFEAAAAGACIVSDAWMGLDLFFEPGREILAANEGEGVFHHVRSLDPRRALTMGCDARRRVLAQHTYSHRAQQVEQALAIRRGRAAVAASRLGPQKEPRIERGGDLLVGTSAGGGRIDV